MVTGWIWCHLWPVAEVVSLNETIRRQRLLAALNGKQSDRVPIFEWPFNLDLYQHRLGYRPPTYNGRDAARVAMQIGLDGVAVFVAAAEGDAPVWLDDKRYRDEWGVLRQRDPAAWPLDAPIGPVAEDVSALADYEGPDPWAPGRMQHVEQALVETDGSIGLVVAIEGPFSIPWEIAGMERFMLMCYDAPEVVDHLTQVCTDFGMVTGQRAVQAGADALIIADDLGHKTGPFLSLKHFRRFILPQFQREIAALRELGVPILLHSCGDVNAYLPDLVAAGIDGLNPLQRTASMDLSTLKAHYGDRICLIGNIDASRTLPYGTAGQVEQEVIEALRIAAPGGGYVLATDHSLHGGIPVPNIMAMIEATHRFGQYPLNLPPCRDRGLPP
jgi:uroporphyrinogen decarboxylase